MASALQTAHDSGVVHRDLKPDNYTLYDIKPDDERFVMLRRDQPESSELILILN